MKPYRKHQVVAFKLRGLLMAPLAALLFFCRDWEWEYDVGVWTTGLLLFVLGVALRVWAQRHLKYRLHGAGGLAMTGPYVWMRNPVYAGNILILAGLCVLCELPWMIPVICSWAAVVYDAAIRFEEYRLTKRYGAEYLAYQQRVGRWWPRVPLAAASPAARPSNWHRAIRVEWQCAMLLLIPAIKETIG